MRTLALSILLGMLALSGCSSLSGLDAKSNFACKAPNGILCESMSGIYANAQAKNLPGQRRKAPVEPAQPTAGNSVKPPPLSSGTPIRSAPRLLRVWFAPWEDSDGDLHDQNYVYLPVDTGRWLIEHNRSRIEETYRPEETYRSSNTPLGLKEDSPLQQQPGSAALSHVTTPDSNSEESIGVRQDRMSNAQAAELIEGIVRPDPVLPNSGSPN